MSHILPGINTIDQHRTHLSSNPEDYRPECCPYCGKSGLHGHGCYGRQSDREHGSRDSLNPVRIPRFQVSFLQKYMLDIARMSCPWTMVSVAYPTGCSDYGLA